MVLRRDGSLLVLPNAHAGPGGPFRIRHANGEECEAKLGAADRRSGELLQGTGNFCSARKRCDYFWILLTA